MRSVLFSRRVILGLAFALFFSFFSEKKSAAGDDVSQSEIIRMSKTRVANLLQEGGEVFKLPGKAKIDTVKKLVRDYLDVESIANFALSRHRNNEAIKSNPKILEEYHDAFADYIISWLSFRLDDRFALAKFNPNNHTYFGGETRKIQINIEPTNGNIRGEVVLHNRAFSADPNAKDWWIIDLIFEGQSKALSYRSEFASVMNKNGGSIQSLLDHIKDRTKENYEKVLNPAKVIK